MRTDEHGYSAQRRQSALAYGGTWEAITPHATSQLSRQYKYVFCSVAGTCVMRDTADTALTLTLTANEILPIIPTRILDTSTGTFIGVIE